MPKPSLPHIISTPALSAEQRVWRLYRNACRTALDHSRYRSQWQKDRVQIRERFEANKDLTDPDMLEKLVGMGEEEVRLKQHPLNTRHPKAPYGTKWQRNMQLPPQALWLTADEEVWFKDTLFYTQNPRKPTFYRRVLRFVGLSGY
ncbi:uncharacterized protein LOC135815311 [Sycon ciliatum]|uniref:uncharacterized protein LOC135815311 n=1 Tax=Sycon ciliatum TaxID=27933 RepID=UPI0020AA580E|eukprot:scpid17763/ scgid19103/ NADH dehydrogenase [ubiquinone] 1 beta subcomplex subunit 9; B22 subunit of eukaryotic mitochondrial complex I; Complex I-B22; NADH-ubiquinone oxidoreductase B22 subunit